ncbi:hypothetical protein SLE2022_320420 [Rubroshorea leprosula]
MPSGSRKKDRQEVRSESVSDGCIINRNRVLQRELNLQEVRTMICNGRKLGMQFDGSEEEMELRLMELEERDESRRKNG